MKFVRIMIPVLFLLGSCSVPKKQLSTPAIYSPKYVEKGIEAKIKWRLIANNYLNQNQSLGEFTIINENTQSLESNWELYFNYAPGRNILNGKDHEEIVIERINGDFFKLMPGQSYKPLNPQDSLIIPVISSAWITKQSEVPGGFYFIFTDQNDSIHIDIPDFEFEPLSATAHTKRHAGDNVPYPTAEQRFVENIKFDYIHPVMLNKIIPSPNKIENVFSRTVLVPEYKIIYQIGLRSEAEFLSKSLEQNLGSALQIHEGLDGGQNSIILSISEVIIEDITYDSGSEAYELDIQKGVIRITGSDPAGVFYAIQSLRALLPVETFSKPSDRIVIDDMIIKDRPRFAYRGMHLDVARNFQPKSSVMRLLDMMSFYKMNKFHFHLTDDEAWRLEIPGIPELIDIGSKRGHTIDENDMLIPAYGSGPYPDPEASSGTGYYSIDEFIEILRYAKERHIEVIPEIDMPGHARAAIKSMKARYNKYMASEDKLRAEMYLLSDPYDRSEYSSVQGYDDNVICVCCNSTYLFIETVINGIVSLYDRAGATLTTIHIGGDEVPHGAWERSPACTKLINFNPEIKNYGDLMEYYLIRVSDILKNKGLTTAGWEEIGIKEYFKDDRKAREINTRLLDRGFQLHSWNSVYDYGGIETGYSLANAGYKVVMCNVSPLYLDMAYDKDPLEPGFYWGGYVNEEKIYSFNPYDVYASVKTDLNGNSVDKSILSDKTRLTNSGKDNILGIQAQLWTETVKSPERMEYMIFPRLILVAERAWAKEPEWINEPSIYELQWNSIANTIGQRELHRMDHLHGGISYRIPLPGAVLKDGILLANVFPGFELRYTTDGSEPDMSSTLYTSPVNVNSGPITIRAFTSNGRAGRSVIAE